MGRLLVKQFSPKDLQGLALWLKADAGVTLSGSDVIAWADQSGNGRNASAYNNPQLITNQINGKPVIDFNASQYFTSDNQNLNNNSSIFFVVKSRGDHGIIFSTSDYEGLVFALTANPNNSFSVGISNLFEIANDGADNGNNWMIGSTIRSNNLTSIIYKNGTQVANGDYDTSSLNPTAPLIIGTDADLNSYWNLDGQIAEIIIYNRALTISERQKVEAYLNTKYAIYNPIPNNKISIKKQNLGDGKISAVKSVIFNNTFNSSVNSQNTTWIQGPYQEITTAPAGCPNSNCLHLSPSPQLENTYGALYSTAGFGQIGMLDLTKSSTIECWFYATSIDLDINAFGFPGAFILLRSDYGDPLSILFQGDRSVLVYVNTEENPGVPYQTSPSIFNLNSWNHIAIVSDKSLGKTTTYINGINSAETPYTTDNRGNPVYEYAYWEWGAGHDFGNGYDIYISNMRWTQRAVYTSNFNPSFVNFPDAQN